MDQPQIRILQPGDEPALEAFLASRLESSMFLIGNMRASGLVDRGVRYEGTYAAAYQDGEIVAVTAHYWNGNLILQAPVHLDAVWRAAVAASGRGIKGLIGPSEQVGAVKSALGIQDDDLQLDETEKLYSLKLADLIVPDSLASGKVQGRRIEERDLELVTQWRVDFSIEGLGDEDGPQLRQQSRESMERALTEGSFWILEEEGKPVATSGFNTAIDEAVQVGGVWTPPELRRRGYGRAAVATSLLDARAEGAEMGILFTGLGNIAAQKAYEALGFKQIGDYRILLLRIALDVA